MLMVPMQVHSLPHSFLLGMWCKNALTQLRLQLRPALNKRSTCRCAAVVDSCTLQIF